MIKIIYILIFFLFAGFVHAQWVPMSNGMNPGTNVSSLAKNSTYLFAGAKNYGVYRSNNFGVGWSQTTMPTVWVYSLVTSGENLFAGTAANGIYRSTNNGFVFTQVYSGGMEIPLAANGNNIFAGNLSPSYGLNLSTNNGDNWTQLFAYNGAIKCIAASGSNIYFGTITEGVYRSTNNGNSFTQTSLNNQDVRSLAINGDNVFAGTNPNGVFLSTNNGSSWTQTSLNNERINALHICDNNIFVGGNNGNIYQSSDNGATWITRNEGGPGGPSAFFTIPSFIWAGGGQGVYGRNLSEMIGIKTTSTEIPSSCSLSQNYPNPFNPSTKIRFEIPKTGFSSIKVYDILGREIATLVNEQLKPGTYEVDWDGSAFTSGVYFYTMRTGSYTETKKMLMIK